MWGWKLGKRHWNLWSMMRGRSQLRNYYLLLLDIHGPFCIITIQLLWEHNERVRVIVRENDESALFRFGLALSGDCSLYIYIKFFEVVSESIFWKKMNLNMKKNFYFLRQDLECSCWWGKEHGGEIGIKRRERQWNWVGEKWRRKREQRKTWLWRRERRRIFFFFFFGLEIGMECIK